MKRALALAALALLVPNSAQADFDHDLARSQGIAAAYWQTHDAPEPTCSPIRVVLDYTGPNLATGRDAGANREDRCVVYYAPHARQDSPPVLCALTVHEYGHLSGWGHVADPSSIMNADVLNIPAECASAWRQVCAPDPVLLRRALRAHSRHARRWLRHAAVLRQTCARELLRPDVELAVGDVQRVRPAPDLELDPDLVGR
jgi:hypothetical protein